MRQIPERTLIDNATFENTFSVPVAQQVIKWDTKAITQIEQACCCSTRINQLYREDLDARKKRRSCATQTVQR